MIVFGNIAVLLLQLFRLFPSNAVPAYHNKRESTEAVTLDCRGHTDTLMEAVSEHKRTYKRIPCALVPLVKGHPKSSR
jgi:hypothetical protein